jgi:hypothetical protein
MRIAQLKANGIQLGKWDSMEEGSPAFEKLTLV